MKIPGIGRYPMGPTNMIFWKVRKIDHQLPKDRNTLTKSKTKTITLNKSEINISGRKGQR